ncbi:hypothetical protein SAMN04487850_0086 [Prevotella aff. ruminicola Tc2-24]|uniref:Uncharacterized protein n=1 Tax=Prevotella aff. ruminicola Tc2-24 TaxID=81582 RepID=A0A1I0LY83_9BACT|nr:hypothetical protein SAMN04487850_0086 [Prevotella aff. ruminicola Tc2-24]
MGYFQNILSDSISGKTSSPEAPYNQDTSGPPLLQVNNLYLYRQRSQFAEGIHRISTCSPISIFKDMLILLVS